MTEHWSRSIAGALIATGLATGVRWLLDPWLGGHIPFVTYYVAILVCGLRQGGRAAVLALVGGLLAGDALFVPPRGVAAIHGPEQIAGLVAYLVVGSTIAWLSQHQRTAALEARAAAATARHEVEERRRVEHALRERVKELKILHTCAQMFLNQEASIPSLLNTVVSILPAAWQYPERAAARITYDGQAYVTQEYRSSGQSQQAAFQLRDGTQGLIEVVYVSECPQADEGPFLIEERHLIHSLAEMLCAALERRTAMAELQGSIEKYESLVTNIPDVIWTTDAEGTTRFISPSIKQVFGFTAEEVCVGGSSIWLGRIHPDDVDKVRTAFRALFHQHERFEVEYRIQRRDGQWIWLHDRSFKTYMKDGVAYADGVFRDITERKRTETALLELNETLEAQVKERTVALLQKKEKLRGLATELSRAEMRERKRLATDLHDNLAQLLALSKLKLATVREDETDRSRVYRDVKALLDDALRYTRTLMTDLGPPLLGNEQDLARAISWVAEKMQRHGLMVVIQDDGSRKLMSEEALTVTYQVVQEFLYNVVKHAQTNSATVQLERVGLDLQAVVIDEGVGFDVSASRRPSQEGGFGLFNVQERVAPLGGRVAITSIPGRGTRATLTMPLLVETVDHQLAGAESQTAGAGGSDHSPSVRIRVLLVDDHPLVRQGLRSMLEGYAALEIIGEAGDGEMAVDLVRQLRPDVVLMDINMPKMSGIDATRIVKAEFPHMIVIGLSMHEDPRIAEAILSAGASQYLTKGGSFDSLLDAITRHAIPSPEGVAPLHESA